MPSSQLKTLVTTNWLRDQILALSQANLKRASLRVLDASISLDPKVDSYKEFYQQSHIPEASHFNLHKLSPGTKGCLHAYEIPDTNRFQDYVESLGIYNDTHVVAYDSIDCKFAFRTWWIFRLFGHNNVSVLDGGFKKWLNDGFEVTVEEPVFERSTFKAVMQSGLIRNFKEMENNITSMNETVIDSRPKAGFVNDRSQLPEGFTGGHIPGSTNIPFPELFNENGTFKSKEELDKIFKGAGVDLNGPIVFTCQRALTACGLSAAAHMLGRDNIPMYNGSFQEWSQKAKPDQIKDGQTADQTKGRK